MERRGGERSSSTLCVARLVVSALVATVRGPERRTKSPADVSETLVRALAKDGLGLRRECRYVRPEAVPPRFDR